MKHKINKNTIPHYFKLENYDEMEKLSALGWLFQLESRYQLHSAIEHYVDSSHHLTDEEKVNFLNLIIRDYFEEPLKLERQYEFFSKAHNEFIKISVYGEYENLPSAITDGAVKVMTTKDFQSNHQFYGHLYLDCSGEEPFIQEVLKYDGGFSSVKKTPIYIDLSHSDETLEKEFKRTLADLRKEISEIRPVKALTNYKLANWASYKLLAYIDLYLWSSLNNIRLKRPVISRALYQSQPDYGEETLRKTVEPIVARLFNSHGVAGDDLDYPSQLFDELTILARQNLENF